MVTTTIGIDEHSFCKNKEKGYREFATIIIDYNGKRVKGLIPGRNSGQLQMVFNFPGRENVRNFPRARIIADNFHVLRLLSPTINKYRKRIEGTTKKDPIRLLFLKNSHKLSYFQREALKSWPENHPELKDIYTAKEALHRVYRCNGKTKAKRSLIRLMDWPAKSKIPELMTLRKTLKSWINEIVNYFENKITNARTEGFNNVAKILQKRAYGFKNFNYYRLRLLNVG